MKRIKKVLLKTAVLIALFISPAYAGLVTNGGFEDTGTRIQKHTNVPKDPDTVGLWKLNETSGTAASDETGTNDGTLTYFSGTGTAGQDIDVADQSQSVSDNQSTLTATYTKFAQAVTPDRISLYAIEFYTGDGVTCDSVDIEVQTDLSGEPSGTTVDNTLITASSLTANTVKKVTYDSTIPVLTVGTPYWIVITRKTGNTDIRGTGSGPSSGTAKMYDGSWGNLDMDNLYFKTYYRSGWTASGKTDGALTFDGKDDYVPCGTHESLNITDNLTIEAWMKQDSDKYNMIASKQFSTPWAFMTYTVHGLRFCIINSAASPTSKTVYSEETLTPGLWYHTVGIFRRPYLYVYVNGEFKKKSSAWDYDIESQPDRYFSISRDGGAHVFNGTIDEVKISNVARICPDSWDVSDNLTTKLYNGCLYQATDVTHDGTYSLKMMPTGAAASTEFSTKQIDQTGPEIALKNKGKYKVSGWIQIDTDYAGDTKPQIVAVSGGNTTTITASEAARNNWHRYHGYITADDTTCTITLKAYGTQGSCWFDDIALEPAPTGTLIMIGELKR